MTSTPDLLSLFTGLCAISSPPGEERPVADRVLAYLRAIGLTADEDGAGPSIGSNAGNVYCRLPGNGATGTPIFFCAHLDTVPPQGPIEPVVEDTLKHVLSLGGTVAAEHGIGKLKRRWLPLQISPIQLGVMRAVKRELDTKGILAPGNVL